MPASLPLSRRRALALGLGAASAAALPARAQDGFTVVELFTSQGCSSCPPADAFLDELAGLPGVLALTFNVDYWDYLGWRDTLASAEFSQRQYDYAKSRGDMEVYTPQIVVDGGKHCVGSNRGAVLAAIDKARGARAARVPVTMRDTETEIVVDVGGASGVGDGTVWVAALAPRIEVAIVKGENAGSTAVYSNVVRRLMPASMWHGEALSVNLPKDAMMGADCKSCVALLQKGHLGPVLGAGIYTEKEA